MHDADSIIYATGFETTNWGWSLDVHGLHGQSLADTWSDRAEAYLGTTVHGFPNMFVLYGPNTNLGHNSILVMLEAQVEVLHALRGHARATARNGFHAKA